MKIRTLAVAVAATAALPMTASAAPDFYGKLNLSVEQVSDYPAGSIADSVEALMNAEDPLADQWQVESRKSRLGVKGEEALNASLNAIYQVELGVDVDGDDVDTDDDANPISVRNSYVGVSSASFGRIFAGRYDSVVKQIEGDVDQFNNTAADMEVAFLGQQRNSSTLNWQSNDLNGLGILAQVGPGEGAAGEDGLADTLGLAVTFNQGPLYAAFGYESSFIEEDVTLPGPPPVTVTEAGDTKVMRAVVGFDLGGGIEVGAALEKAELDLDTVEEDGTSFLVSARMQANERLAFKGQLTKYDGDAAELMTITLGSDYKLGNFTKAYGLVSLSDAEAGGSDESGNLIAVGLEHNF